MRVVFKPHSLLHSNRNLSYLILTPSNLEDPVPIVQMREQVGEVKGFALRHTT